MQLQAALSNRPTHMPHVCVCVRLYVCSTCSNPAGIPIVFDFHHWKFCTGNQTQEDAFRTALTTWPAGVCIYMTWVCGGWVCSLTTRFRQPMHTQQVLTHFNRFNNGTHTLFAVHSSTQTTTAQHTLPQDISESRPLCIACSMCLCFLCPSLPFAPPSFSVCQKQRCAASCALV